ncbi:MAG: hypothetical protein KA807_20500 [Prolixibacteraceae bacterium]|nr:hypothetical protein [Prolixibacteraceae bacterium]
MRLHTFTNEGLAEFSQNLLLVKTGAATDLDKDNLFSAINIRKYRIDIDLPEFDPLTSKNEFIVTLTRILEPIELRKELYNSYLWSWLSAYYFDLVCPFEVDRRNPKAEERHILSSENWRRYYRHLIAAPVRLYTELGDLAVGYLDGKIDVHGEYFEQLASAQDIATSPGIIEAANILFWDFNGNRFKHGSRGKDKPGTIRRFARDVIPQYQMTYDLNSMRGQEIVSLLPHEFDRWLED